MKLTTTQVEGLRTVSNMGGHVLVHSGRKTRDSIQKAMLHRLCAMGLVEYNANPKFISHDETPRVRRFLLLLTAAGAQALHAHEVEIEAARLARDVPEIGEACRAVMADRAARYKLAKGAR